MSSMDRRQTLTDWIGAAWNKTAVMFNDTSQIFWTEAASLNYPFYHKLSELKNKYVDKNTVIIPEYSPVPPIKRGPCKRPACICQCKSRNKWQGNQKIDLCIVNLDNGWEKIDEDNYWCYPHRPLVAIELKYLDGIDTEELESDVRKLKFMIEHWSCELAYLCIAANERPTRKKLPKEFQKISSKNIEKLYIASYTYNLNEKVYEPEITPYNSIT